MIEARNHLARHKAAKADHERKLQLEAQPRALAAADPSPSAAALPAEAGSQL